MYVYKYYSNIVVLDVRREIGKYIHPKMSWAKKVLLFASH